MNKMVYSTKNTKTSTSKLQRNKTIINKFVGQSLYAFTASCIAYTGHELRFLELEKNETNQK